ncbi:MAG TPA: sugar ABC transporter permease [Candidatus Sulfotelmatobacter sp.]|nr:sugar ABC transporter permease [Candidatus Sulfotelmatobacter sp.]
MAPAILLVLGVSFYPALFAIRRSFYATRYMELGRFIGLEHYVRFLGRGAGWQSIGNSLTYTAASLCLALPLGFLLALILHRPLPCRAVIRTILILPWIVSQTIVALLWGWLLNPNYGPVSYLAGAWSAWRLDVFGTPEWAMAGVVLANVWQSYAFPMVLLLAALQTIPAEVVEAARVDGASPWAAFWRITLPLVRPTLLITAIMLTLHYFNMVTLIFTLTGGGPGGATETLSVRVFNEAFVFHNLGFASMVGVIIFFLNAAFSLSYIRVLQREP